MEALSSRFRQTLMLLFAAVIAAALLRHAIHEYAGIDREQIREIALSVVLAALLAFALLTRRAG